ncbi:MAG TPA: patatin-like phospholipase family protein [Longimicrobium sp.]|nr:patatin-like phospholipase family protein [Longimicrobium sp.]
MSDPIHPPARSATPPARPAGEPDDPFTFTQVFRAELDRLRPGVIDAAPVPYTATREERHAATRRIFTQVHQKLDGAEGSPTEPLAALCLSGGGIRSATFNLGVLQALARCKVLPRFDYLSSVSGGGYIAGWFEAWRHTAHGEVFTELGGKKPDNPLGPEPKPVDHLREYANYLTPRTGLFSVDLWTAVAVIARNLLLNWLVVIPVLAALVALPQLALLIVQGRWRPNAWYLGIAGLVLGFAAHLATFLYREAQMRHTTEARRREDGPRAADRHAPGSPAGRRQVALIMAPLWLSALLMATAGRWTPDTLTPRYWARTLVCAVAWMVASPLVAWAVSLVALRPRGAPQRRLGWELAALVISGGLAAGVLLFVVIRLGLEWFKDHPPVFVALAVPAFLTIHLLAHTLFVAVASRAERGTGAHAPTTEMDREWWARYSGWVLVAAVGWLGVSGLVMATPWVAKAAGAAFTKWLAGVGGVSGAVVWLAGKSSKTLSGRRDDAAGGSKVLELAVRVAAPLFCLVIAMLLALATASVASQVTSRPHLLTTDPDLLAANVPFATIATFAGMIVALALVGSAAAAVVNVNRFSAQAMYRNRLVRAYLGASNQERTPDPFSGFDPADDFFLHELWDDGSAEGPGQRPLACINATLNLVSGGEKLAWQQRKAESFSMTPLYCGNFHDGYRSTREYGGAGGMRLGSAVAISGAAANPNMGFHSSAGITFLLTLFNARLGAWLGNTGKPGAGTYRLPGPRWALRPILSELFGQTSSRNPYVNLSDGGHFENLGIYEMVLRRCRYLVVSDAASDPDARFADLGNAIRKVRIDFGVPIEFEKAILISPRKDQPTAVFCALATIGYSKVDAEAADGKLIYLKPAVYGRGRKTVPYDVRAYANTSEFFPHESTADQWFDESQFESYRALGLHTIEQITDDCAGAGDMATFFAAVTGYLADREEAQKKDDRESGISDLVSTVEKYLSEAGGAARGEAKAGGDPVPPGAG